MRIIVCGSRGWTDRELIASTLSELIAQYGSEITIVHGNAGGADRIADQEAEKAGLLIEKHPAQWGSFGKAAGPIRNREMAAAGADLCVAFWNGSSKGTQHMMNQAEQHEIPVKVVRQF